MNAFRRGHAITGLEELSLVICMHIVLAVSFPNHEACPHWSGELDGFVKTLQRWNRGKKNAKNYTAEIITDALNGILLDGDEQELIEGHVEAKGLNPEHLDFKKASEFAIVFAKNVID
jgi:hypothetical protein